MPSSYTSSARFTLQATGENNNTWGVILNQGVFQLVDDSVCGRLAFALSGAKALTVNQGATDEARMAFLDVTGGAGGTITVPSVAKGYFVHNGAAGVVNLSAGGPLLPIQPGDAGPVFGDGATLYPILVGGLTITAQLAAMKSYIDAAIAGAVVNLPAMIGHAEQLLTNDGTVASWGPRISDAYAFRNRIINGDMRIDQRHAGGGVIIGANSFGLTVDRWQCQTAGATLSAGAGQQADKATLGVWINTVQAALAAADYLFLYHAIEGLNVADLLWGTANAKAVTISCAIGVTTGGDYSISVTNGANNQSYVHKVTLPSGGTFNYSFTVPGPTTGVWAADNTRGVTIRFCMAAGATWKTAILDAWQAGFFFAASTQYNMAVSTANNYYLTNVQFEVGSVATPFEHRAFAQELMLCQRYYETSIEYGITVANAVTGVSFVGAPYSAGSILTPAHFKVEKRAQPIMAFYSATRNVSVAGCWSYLGAGGAWTNSTSTVVSQVTPKYCEAAVNGAFTANVSYLVAGNWAADAEL